MQRPPRTPDGRPMVCVRPRSAHFPHIPVLRLAALFLILTLVASAATATADEATPGTVVVSVTDATGGVLVGATCEIAQAPAAPRATVADAEGRCRFEGLPPGQNRAHAALRAHWDQLRHPLYAVFIELQVAARTDPELADILAPAEAAFARELQQTAREVVPEWNQAGPQFEIGYELATCTLRGMALKQFVPGGAEPSEDFFRYLEKQLADLAREGRSMPVAGGHPAHATRN